VTGAPDYEYYQCNAGIETNGTGVANIFGAAFAMA
jgi:hypothetical protein